jgi:urease accessory protein
MNRYPHSHNHRFVLLLLLISVPLAAQAHPGHEIASSFSEGLTHPLSGVDHLLAMLAVGLWAGQLGRPARWLLSLCFVGVMTVGGALAVVGVRLPGTEAIVLCSVLVSGLALATAARAPITISGGLVGIFALAHGSAHGVEMGPGTSAVLYGCGLVLTTVVLQLAGLELGRLAIHSQRQKWLRYAGVGIASVGGMLCLGW